MIAAFLNTLPPAFTNETPYYAMWLVFAALGWTAWRDAWTGRVSRPWIIAGFLVAIFASQQAEGWYLAGVRLTVAMAVFVALRLLNEVYFQLLRRDPYGYGDMRWSALAAYAFGVVPTFWAWIFGAWLGVIFLGLSWLISALFDRPRPRGFIHFAPFLLVGLLLALYGRPYVALLLAHI